MKGHPQRRDNQGRFAPQTASEAQTSLTPREAASHSPVDVAKQLEHLVGFRPGAAHRAVGHPSSAVRASARIVGWDLPHTVRHQFDADEQKVLNVVRPDLAESQ